MKQLLRAALLAGMLASVSACATMGPDGMPLDDPLERSNRAVFVFNDKLDQYFLDPLIRVWRFVVPSFVRTGFRNFVENLGTPISVANAALQGDLEGTAIEFERFLVNSTLGIGGLFDVASMAGIEPRNEDFGQTLAVWGVPAGPYLMVPFLGPKTLRDLTGDGVDALGDPNNYAGTNALLWPYALGTMSFFHSRDKAHEAIQQGREQIDPYIALRRVYLQNRIGKIRNGAEIRDAGEDYDGLPDYEDYGDYEDYENEKSGPVDGENDLDEGGL